MQSKELCLPQDKLPEGGRILRELCGLIVEWKNASLVNFSAHCTPVRSFQLISRPPVDGVYQVYLVLLLVYWRVLSA